jgi:hypothetical protein
VWRCPAGSQKTLEGAAICNKNANGETLYLAEKLQDKWNKIINSDNSKDWKSDGCLKYFKIPNLKLP